MKILAHPLFQRDLAALAGHVAGTSGDPGAARRRLAEARALVDSIIADPAIGAQIGEALPGWRVRHGGRDRRITVVYRHSEEDGTLFLAMAAFGGRDWMSLSGERSAHFRGA